MINRTMWDAMLTDAIKMPAENPARINVIAALERARIAAVAKAGSPTSPQWYKVAVASVEAETDVPVQQMVFRMLSKAYREGRAEVLKSA